MSETILVTGGAGFIGSHLVDALVEEGHHVRVYDNLEPQVHGGLREARQWPDYCNPDAEYILGDVRDRESLHKAMQNVDVIFHEAAMVGVGQSMYQIERYVDVNTRGTAILLDILVNDAAIRDRVRKLVVASSMSIYGEGKYECPVHGVVYPRLRDRQQLTAHDWEVRCPLPVSGQVSNGASGVCNRILKALPTDEDKPLYPTSIYAISKKDQEEMCLSIGQTYEIPTVALRYFNTYGPRQALGNPYTGVAAIFSSRYLNGNPPIIFEDGLQSRDFIHVSDVVQANMLVMADARADYGIFNVGSGQVIRVLDVANALRHHLDSPVEPLVENEFRAGDIRHCFADVRALKRLGYQPNVPFEEGVGELVDWVQRQSAVDIFEQARQELHSRGLTV